MLYDSKNSFVSPFWLIIVVISKSWFIDPMFTLIKTLVSLAIQRKVWVIIINNICVIVITLKKTFHSTHTA